MPRTRSVLSLVAAAAATCLVSALLIPTQAQASGWPSSPSGIRVVAVTGSSFTVTTNRATNTRYYRVYASTVHSDLYYTNLHAGRHPSTLHWGTSTSPRITVSGLPYTTKPYYWRVENFTGSAQSYSATIYQRGLRPATPTGLSVHESAAGGTYLTWGSGAATGFAIQRALDPGFTSYVHTFVIRGNNHQFTPYSLAQGRRYYFRIRAQNINSYSAYGTATSGVKSHREQPLKAMTYNIAQATSDGTRASGGVLAPWSQRRPAGAALIRSVNPDVVAVQEAWPYIGDPSRHVRQVDSLRSALLSAGAHYSVAHTENVYGEYPYARLGNYILYNYDRYRVIGTPWHWDIGYRNAAVYAELQNKSNGARFLFISTHLMSTVGRTYDSNRATETATMVSYVNTEAARLGNVPVIYGGDFNSDPEQNAYDGPNAVMHSNSNLIADTRLVAQTRYNERYDSMNDLKVVPNAYSLFIDYVYATPGVSASTWGMAMRLSSGRMVGVIPSDHNPVWAWVQIPY